MHLDNIAVEGLIREWTGFNKMFSVNSGGLALSTLKESGPINMAFLIEKFEEVSKLEYYAIGLCKCGVNCMCDICRCGGGGNSSACCASGTCD